MKLTSILLILIMGQLISLAVPRLSIANECSLSDRVDFDTGIPSHSDNNYWYCENESDTAFVFVHGFLGDSKTTWLDGSSYWPNIVANDPSYEEASIFLGGFDTEITSFKSGIIEASNSLFSALNTKHRDSQAKVLAKKSIIFVAHSLGGIVVRNMLNEHTSSFANKKVGIVLIASPSLGSEYSDRNAAILKLLNNKLGKQLEWNSDLLRKIDRDFRRLIDEQRIPSMAGIEVLEGKLIVPSWLSIFGIADELVVDESSGARYWFDPMLLDREDHLSIVKPIDAQAPIHREVLANFMQNRFESLPIPRLKVVIMDSPNEAYKLESGSTGKMNAHHVATLLRTGNPELNLDIRIVPVHREFNDFVLVDQVAPDLVIIHYSAWRDGRDKESEAVRKNSVELLVQFGTWLRLNHPDSKLIIYTRVGEEAYSDREEGRNIDCLPILPILNDCGYFVSKRGARYSNFKNTVIENEFRLFVSKTME